MLKKIKQIFVKIKGVRMQSIIVKNIQIFPDHIKFESTSKDSNNLKWNDVLEILIETNDQGPIADDVFFVLATRDVEIKIPQTDSNAEELFMRLQGFEGFDNQTFIDSMSSSENKRFVCWKK